MAKKILLPTKVEHREYVIYLYKNRNSFHGMNDVDVNNLIKLLNYGKLESNDFPILKKKDNKVCKLDGYCFNSKEYFQN